MHYEKKCFLPKSCKRKKRSLWNTLQQFGTHTEQFHFRASSKLSQWMLVNKGNLHWKFLQEHRPFHVSQQGSSAFTPGLVLFLSLFLCSSPFCLVPTPRPALCAYLSLVQHQNPLRSVSVATISLPILVPTYLTSGVQEKCLFQSVQLEKKPTLKTLSWLCFPTWHSWECSHGELPGIFSWLQSRNPAAAPLLWQRKTMDQAAKSNISLFRSQIILRKDT